MRDESTGLIGRDNDTRSVLAGLAHARLVTLTGPGGVGKTRLAQEVASELDTEFDRIVFIDLSVATSPREIELPLDLGTLDLSKTLLLFDNCEHVIEGAAAKVEEVLRVSKETKVLATSRRPLHVAGERLHPVRPLSIPQFGEPVSDLLTYEAIQLFVECSAQLDASFELSGANAEAVAEICRLSDGLPIAIELAAGLTRSRPVGAIANAMKAGDSHDLLLKRRDVHPHQRSVARSVGWSLDLLDADARHVLSCAAIFRGSFTTQALEMVHRTVDGTDTARLLDVLVEHSLATFDASTERYALLALVSNAVRASTNSDLTASLMAAHTLWALEVSRSIEDRATEPDPDRTFAGYRHDSPDLAWVAERLVESEATDTWLQLVGPIAEWWVHQGGKIDVKTWQAALADESWNDPHRIGLANGLAFHLSHTGDYVASLRFACRSRAAASVLNRADLEIYALIAIGNAHHSMSNSAEAANAYTEATTVELDRPNAYLSALVQLCLARTAEGAAQRETLIKGLELAGASHPAIKVMAEQELARNALEQGDLAGATKWAATGVGAAVELGFPEAEGTAQNTLGSIAIAQGSHVEAELAHRAAITIGQEIGHAGLVSEGLVGIATILAARGSSDRATRVTKLAIELAPTVDIPVELSALVDRPLGPLLMHDLRPLLATMARDIESEHDVVSAATMLTERETSVLFLLRGDLTQREIADELYVSPSTIRTHVKSIYRKLGVHNRTSCIHHATVAGLLPAPS